MQAIDSRFPNATSLEPQGVIGDFTVNVHLPEEDALLLTTSDRLVEDLLLIQLFILEFFLLSTIEQGTLGREDRTSVESTTGELHEDD